MPFVRNLLLGTALADAGIRLQEKALLQGVHKVEPHALGITNMARMSHMGRLSAML